MAQKSEQSDSPFAQPKDVFTLVLGLANTHAACLHPFHRARQGVDVPGILGVWALLLMGVYGESTRSIGMARYIVVWLVALVIMRLRRDRSQHSQYHGYPWWIVKLPPVRWLRAERREASAKALEPLICLGIGVCIYQWSEPGRQLHRRGLSVADGD